MEKTIICEYWLKKNCKYMNDSSICKFAHGFEDIKEITIDCKYGIMCNNSLCDFYHGNVTTTTNMVYDIPIINKRKNKINKLNVKKEITADNNDIKNNNILSIPNLPRNVIQYGIKDEIINNKNGMENDNKLLSSIDEFYIKKYNTMVYSKNRYISMVVADNYKQIVCLDKINKNNGLIINKLNNENKSLKKYIEELKIDNNEKTNTITELVEEGRLQNYKNTPKSVNNVVTNKIINLYIKYVKLYNLFKNSNYKQIDINEVRKYTKDKNIYKIKQRAEKVNSFYDKFKKGIYTCYLPINKIIKMTF